MNVFQPRKTRTDEVLEPPQPFNPQQSSPSHQWRESIPEDINNDPQNSKKNSNRNDPMSSKSISQKTRKLEYRKPAKVSAPEKTVELDTEILRQMIVMGFPFNLSRVALLKFDNNLQRSTEFCLNVDEKDIDRIVTEHKSVESQSFAKENSSTVSNKSNGLAVKTSSAASVSSINARNNTKETNQPNPVTNNITSSDTSNSLPSEQPSGRTKLIPNNKPDTLRDYPTYSKLKGSSDHHPYTGEDRSTYDYSSRPSDFSSYSSYTVYSQSMSRTPSSGRSPRQSFTEENPPTIGTNVELPSVQESSENTGIGENKSSEVPINPIFPETKTPVNTDSSNEVKMVTMDSSTTTAIAPSPLPQETTLPTYPSTISTVLTQEQDLEEPTAIQPHPDLLYPEPSAPPNLPHTDSDWEEEEMQAIASAIAASLEAPPVRTPEISPVPLASSRSVDTPSKLSADPTIVVSAVEPVSDPHSGDSSCPGVRKREFLPFKLVQNKKTKKWSAVVSLKQVNLRSKEQSPQGSRPDNLNVGDVNSREHAESICLALAPPMWRGKNDPQVCILCTLKFSMFRTSKHCRNCGFLVCTSCSEKLWPSSMIPNTYHNNEKFVRVCHSCLYLTEKFVEALLKGDKDTALAICSTGNVNLHNPFSVYVHAAFPIHCAAAGGNLTLLCWLMDTKRCSYFASDMKTPLTTAGGLSALALAAKYGHQSIMEYLVREKKASVLEIQDQIFLQRALHVVLKAPGAPPKLKKNTKEDVEGTPIDPDNAITSSSQSAQRGAAASQRAPRSPTSTPVAVASAVAVPATVNGREQNLSFHTAANVTLNTMGVDAPILSQNSVTNAAMVRKGRNKNLNTTAVFHVNHSIELLRQEISDSNNLQRHSDGSPVAATLVTRTA